MKQLFSYFIATLIVFSIDVKAQNTSASEQFINWAEVAAWSDGAAPRSNRGGEDIVIDGSVLRNSAFVLGTSNVISGTSNPSDLTIKTGDSLVILGNLTINPDSRLIVEDGAYLYVDGNLNNDGEFFLFFFATGDGGEAANDGVIAVNGNYNQGPGASINNDTGDFYVEGNSPVPTKGKIPPEVQNVYNVLPIELTSFEAEYLEIDQEVALNWATAKEEDFSHFEIERATDKGDFELIGIIQGSGNTLSEVLYNWRDFSAPYGKIFYRLKAVDNDGSFDYSEIVSVQKSIKGDLQVYPNPANSIKQIQLNLPASFTKKLEKIILYDLSGNMLYQKTDIDLNQEKISFPEVDNGMYLLSLHYNGLTENIRVAIQ